MGEPRFMPTDSRCPNCGGTNTHQWSCPDWRMCDDCQADWGIRDHRWGEIWAAAVQLASLTEDLRIIYPLTCACGEMTAKECRACKAGICPECERDAGWDTLVCPRHPNAHVTYEPDGTGWGKYTLHESGPSAEECPE